MKFIDRYWQVRKGVSAYHPTQAYEIKANPDDWSLHAPTQRIAPDINLKLS